MKHIIIGTAGHIDHGKTTLIKALTGCNTDRWKEEQERGITIDLGFAFFDLPNGDRAGIVDVPGHEKFIHNMVTGVCGMDMVLLVIAADEGIMPQTKEHMDILHLLGIQKCIVVLNKMDLVDPEWLELMEEEVRDQLQDTFLKDAPVVKVSAVTGEGLKELTDEIVKMETSEVQEKEIHTIPRLPIDRVFTISGFGTIVTGTLISGIIRKDDTLQLYPWNAPCKVRNIQVHGKNVDECSAGQRVAVNLTGIKKEDISRGDVLASPNSMKGTTLLDVKLKILKDSNRIVKNRSRLHLFTGTSEVLCRAILLDRDEVKAGEECFAQLRLEQELALRKGDRFVVRFYSPMETIGGGEVLEPNPKAKRRFKEEALEELRRKEAGSSVDVVQMHVKSHRDTLITITELAKLTALSEEEIRQDVSELEDGSEAFVFPMKKDTYVWMRDDELYLQEQIKAELKKYHHKYPYRHGIKKAEIQTKYMKKIKPVVAAKIFEHWETEESIISSGEYLHLPEFEILKDARYEGCRKLLLNSFEKAEYQFVKLSETDVEKEYADMAEDILLLLREENQLVRLSEDAYTVKPLLETAAEKIREVVHQQPVITISEVRDLFSTSRKNAKLILEYTDGQRITRNTGAESEWKAY
ncbi:SelB translation factor [uncultured Clostridium sp.]|uniref:Selenocysteine-specific elongation factor n=1 Tax=Muricoprocola aceti TaxID=2981772 RepID=A0ABT2SNI7_9FIRM|nr:selenocysteine-specific translation elongation factor [Muricoprocola aceti]MCU6726082.1 selenocysteine-specific translation elongation factor [Muricoprocola aceti]SCH77181.1 SelB translation factor [uncultured Clostridium sp.]